MDFELSEEQRAMQHTARAFARAAMMPFARQWDEDEIFPDDTRTTPRRSLRARRHKGVHFGRRPLRRLPRYGAHGGRGAARHLVLPGRERHARAQLRSAGEEARLALAADNDGDIRVLPRARRKPYRR